MHFVIVALDVDYRADHAVVACVGFERWDDATAAFERTRIVRGAPAAYVPGAFYLRELPYLVALLKTLDARADVVIVDGYVTLAPGKGGLGAHLHRSYGVPVIGVAKTEFRRAPHAPLLRGTSKRPLFITSAGMKLDAAVAAIRSMHGPHRVPTLLARVDRLSGEG